MVKLIFPFRGVWSTTYFHSGLDQRPPVYPVVVVSTPFYSVVGQGVPGKPCVCPSSRITISFAPWLTLVQMDISKGMAVMICQCNRKKYTVVEEIE